MQVHVLYFGVLKDRMRRQDDRLQLPATSSVGSLLTTLRAESDGHSRLWETLAVAVNQEYASVDTQLQDGDEVALLPPVSGGLDLSPVRGPLMNVGLRTTPIPTDELLAAAKAGEDGAIVLFDGIVRNNTRGRETLYLVYEAYEEMALAQMQSLATEALERFAIRDVTLVHRLGRLEIGETSVLVLVASAHRGAAFDACRFLIDTLKKTVPIWKKEHFVDGAVWADGEPFPDAISIASSPVAAK